MHPWLFPWGCFQYTLRGSTTTAPHPHSHPHPPPPFPPALLTKEITQRKNRCLALQTEAKHTKVSASFGRVSDACERRTSCAYCGASKKRSSPHPRQTASRRRRRRRRVKHPAARGRTAPGRNAGELCGMHEVGRSQRGGCGEGGLFIGEARCSPHPWSRWHANLVKDFFFFFFARLPLPSELDILPTMILSN